MQELRDTLKRLQKENDSLKWGQANDAAKEAAENFQEKLKEQRIEHEKEQAKLREKITNQTML